jgi:hypothetical protein
MPILPNPLRRHIYKPAPKKVHKGPILPAHKNAVGKKVSKPKKAVPVDPQLLRARKTVEADLNPQIAGAKDYEAGLKVLYANLANNENAAAQMMQGAQQKTRSSVGSNYDQLASGIAANFKASQEGANTELQRLGIGMGDTSQANEQQARLQMLANSGRANALTTVDAQSQGANQLMSLLQGESAATGAGLSAASAQKRGMLESSRPGKVYSLWQTLEDQARADAAERQQQQFLNRITRAKFGVESDYKQAQSLSALASARKNIAASKKPRVVRKKRIGP